MAKHLSIATALDKNRMNTATVYLILLEIDVLDPDTGAVTTTIRAVQNNENVVFQGLEYMALPFEIEVSQEQDKSATARLSVVDFGQTFQAALQEYGASLDWPARIKVINMSNTSETVEVEQDFILVAAVAKDDNYTIEFTLGAENPLTLRFPYRQQFRNRCEWTYKGTECAYGGALVSCDFTLDGPNGCRAHANTRNYSGFFGLAKAIT